MTRRTIPAPMALPQATYWRLRLQERTTNGTLVDRGYHHQPFATHDAAVAALNLLYDKVPLHQRSKVHISVVQVNGSAGSSLGAGPRR